MKHFYNRAIMSIYIYIYTCIKYKEIALYYSNAKIFIVIKEFDIE